MYFIISSGCVFLFPGRGTVTPIRALSSLGFSNFVLWADAATPGQRLAGEFFPGARAG